MNRLLALAVSVVVCSFQLHLAPNVWAMTPQEFEMDRRYFEALRTPELPDTGKEIGDLELRLDRAEARASNAGRLILQKGRSMVNKGEILVGSCWDYVFAVYKRAGYTLKNILVPFKRKKAGSYADLNEVQPGDWFYFLNHAYHNIGHSGIFVDWFDFSKRRAIILSYSGQNKRQPGQYKIYDVTHVYHIIRPQPVDLPDVQADPSSD